MSEKKSIGDFLPQAKGRKAPGICRTAWCTRETSRTNCCNCRKKFWRIMNPCRDAYNNLRSNAKRRRKSMTLTYEQFEFMCQQTGYLELRGRSSMDMSIDRVESSGGYTLDNIAVVTVSVNSAKSNRDYLVVDGVKVKWTHHQISNGEPTLAEAWRRKAVDDRLRECGVLPPEDGNWDDVDDEVPRWLGGSSGSDDPF